MMYYFQASDYEYDNPASLCLMQNSVQPRYKGTKNLPPMLVDNYFEWGEGNKFLMV